MNSVNLFHLQLIKYEITNIMINPPIDKTWYFIISYSFNIESTLVGFELFEDLLRRYFKINKKTKKLEIKMI
jgi:glucose-6-phosphate isomerase